MIYQKLTEVPKENEWSSGSSSRGRYVIVVDNNRVMRLNARDGTSLIPQLGKLSNLTTENKETLVDAINELDSKISATSGSYFFDLSIDSQDKEVRITTDIKFEDLKNAYKAGKDLIARAHYKTNTEEFIMLFRLFSYEEDKDFTFVSITNATDSKINIGSFYIRNNTGETEIAWFGLTDIKPFSEFSNRLLPEVDSSKHGQVLAVAEDGSWTTISISTSSGDIVSSTDDNKIKILSDKTMEVNNITVDKLVESNVDNLVLFGGNA